MVDGTPNPSVFNGGLLTFPVGAQTISYELSASCPIDVPSQQAIPIPFTLSSHCEPRVGASRSRTHSRLSGGSLAFAGDGPLRAELEGVPTSTLLADSEDSRAGISAGKFVEP